MKLTYYIRFFLCLFITIAAPISVQAQQYFLDLSHQKLSLPGRSLYVEQVVDGRAGKPSIGVVYRGLDNRPTAVMFRENLETELTSFLQRELPARPTDHIVVLCLRQLRVSEVLNGITEEASADLAADVYVRLPDGYHFVQSVASRISKRALETTALHDNHLAVLLQVCLAQLQMAPWDQASAKPAKALAELPADVPTTTSGMQAKALPAILRETPRRGIYYTFNQFLTNRPDSMRVVRLDTVPLKIAGHPGKVLWAGTTRVRPKIMNAQKRWVWLDAWAYSDGRQMYVQHQDGYFPLVRQRNFFTFVGEAYPDVEYMRAKMNAQVRAAVIGFAPVRAQDHTGEPTGYAVDMRTGQLAPYPNPLRPRPPQSDTAYVYIYRRTDTSPAPAIVYIGTQEVGRLRPNEYMELCWPYHARIMRIAIQMPGANFCQLLIPDASRPNYLQVPANATSAISSNWYWVPATQGEADLNEIDRQHGLPTR